MPCALLPTRTRTRLLLTERSVESERASAEGEFNRLARFQWKPQRADGLSDPRLFWAYKEQVNRGAADFARPRVSVHTCS